jgi:hypothetical protein
MPRHFTREYGRERAKVAEFRYLEPLEPRQPHLRGEVGLSEEKTSGADGEVAGNREGRARVLGAHRRARAVDEGSLRIVFFGRGDDPSSRSKVSKQYQDH